MNLERHYVRNARHYARLEQLWKDITSLEVSVAIAKGDRLRAATAALNRALREHVILSKFVLDAIATDIAAQQERAA